MKKVLVVDDEEDILVTIKQGLEHLDDSMEVIHARTGEECLKILENGEKPDIIILDIMMPGMNGWQVLNRLREDPKWSKIPVVFLTAKTDDFTKTFGKTVTDDFIEKPFELDDLKNRIDKVLKKLSKTDYVIE